VAGTVNLADARYRASDEDFAWLMKAAFADLRRAREENLREMRLRILALQLAARERLQKRDSARPDR
jgi:hypothetical protein